MLENMKKELSQNIKKAYSTGKTTNKEIVSIVEDGVLKILEKSKKGAVDINKISKEAITASIKELESHGKVEKAKIDAVITGVINAANKETNEIINKTEMELLKTKYRLKEEQDKLALRLKDVLDGAKEATLTLSDETKKDVEDAVLKAKVKSARMLGLMESALRQSIKTVIVEGKEVESKVAHIAKDAATDALEKGRLSTEKIKNISKEIILSSIQEAQKLKKDIEETTRGAVEGVRQAIVEEITKTEKKLLEAKNKVADFIEEDVKQTIEDLENANDDFVEVLSDIASSVGESSKKVLDKSITITREDVSQIKKSSEKAVDTAIAYLKEAGSNAAYTVKEKTLDLAEATLDEASELSKKMVEVTKGAFSGMVEGAKKALKKDEEK